jgi:hypothetical protein
MEYIRHVFQRFKEEALNLRLKKCFFGLHEMEYMGISVSVDKISVRQRKSRPLQTSQCLRRKRKFLFFCETL